MVSILKWRAREEYEPGDVVIVDGERELYRCYLKHKAAAESRPRSLQADEPEEQGPPKPYDLCWKQLARPSDPDVRLPLESWRALARILFQIVEQSRPDAATEIRVQLARHCRVVGIDRGKTTRRLAKNLEERLRRLTLGRGQVKPPPIIPDGDVLADEYVDLVEGIKQIRRKEGGRANDVDRALVGLSAHYYPYDAASPSAVIVEEARKVCLSATSRAEAAETVLALFFGCARRTIRNRLDGKVEAAWRRRRVDEATERSPR